MPLSVGNTRTQSRAGSSGSGTSPRWIMESALVATSGLPPEALTMAKLGIDRVKVSASNAVPAKRSFLRAPSGQAPRTTSAGTPKDNLLGRHLPAQPGRIFVLSFSDRLPGTGGRAGLQPEAPSFPRPSA